MPACQLTMLSNHACTEDLDSWNFVFLKLEQKENVLCSPGQEKSLQAQD